ncbi:MAG: YlzJ-like family protein [Clostridia bacterium]|nr:YlzJ-like family protein [Clostridia bacterium]
MPMEAVFAEGHPRESQSGFLEMDYMGEKVEVMPLSNNEYVIQRVISTSLKAYMNPQLMPGTVIKGKIGS